MLCFRFNYRFLPGEGGGQGWRGVCPASLVLFTDGCRYGVCAGWRIRKANSVLENLLFVFSAPEEFIKLSYAFIIQHVSFDPLHTNTHTHKRELGDYFGRGRAHLTSVFSFSVLSWNDDINGLIWNSFFVLFADVEAFFCMTGSADLKLIWCDLPKRWCPFKRGGEIRDGFPVPLVTRSSSMQMRWSVVFHPFQICLLL